LPGPEITPGAKIAGAGNVGFSIAVVDILLDRFDTTDWANVVAVNTKITARHNVL
jgi:hypothetical protein